MRRTKTLVTVFVLIAVGVVIADQATKLWALAALKEGDRTPVLGDLLGVTLVRNEGAALSIGTGMTWVFTVAAVVVTVVVLRIANRLGSRGWTLALGLLLGGAVGNLIDRLFREPGFARGHVVDFIAYGDWFVGNVADIAIVAAAALMVILGIRGVGVDGGRLYPDETGAGEAGDGRDAADAGTAGAADRVGGAAAEGPGEPR